MGSPRFSYILRAAGGSRLEVSFLNYADVVEEHLSVNVVPELNRTVCLYICPTVSCTRLEALDRVKAGP